jgi:hypothetical protein
MTCARRLIAATAIALLACAALSGCAQTVSGHPSSPAAELGARLQRGMSSAHSAHLVMLVGVGGETVRAEGDETFSHSSTTAFDLTESIPLTGTLRMILAGGKLYVRLPAALNPTDKPWVRVKANTTDPALVPLAQALQQVKASASLRQYSLFAHAAAGIRDVGPSAAHGIAAELYTFSVLVARLPQDVPGIAALRASGLRSVPVRLWVDDHSRVVRMIETVTAGGQQSSTQLDLSNYDEPVSISAPPAGQIATH